MFGIASGKLMPLIKAIAGTPELRYVGVRHEASAAFMAAGAFAGTGRIAVCLGETAPGGLNLLSGMGVSFANNLPVLAITSSHASHLAAPSRGAFSAGDNERLFSPLVKWSGTVREPRRIPEVIRWALREALSGRPVRCIWTSRPMSSPPKPTSIPVNWTRRSKPMCPLAGRAPIPRPSPGPSS